MSASLNRRQFLHTSSALTLGVAATARSHAAAGDRPNILFIMTDQQSAYAMSCRTGQEHIYTPNMDSLAEEGTLFTRAYATNPLCMPMRNALFTGRYTHETGVTKNEAADFDKEEFLNMGNYFRRAGYETAYFGKWHLCFDKDNIDSHGFETAQCLHGNGHDSEVGDLSVQYLLSKKENAPKPWLAVVSLSNPHDVCQLARHQKLPSGPVGDPPPPEECPPAPANLEPPENETDTMAVMRRGYQAPGTLFPVGDFTADDWRQQRWGYYRLIEKVDGEIGRVLDALRESGHEENTWVIFTSDHGDCVGAHRWNQKTVFYDESARIPLIVRRKGLTEKAESEKLVNMGIDVLPTMLEAAGIQKPDKLPGRSLLPIARGEAPAVWREYVVAQNHLAQAGEIEEGFVPEAHGRMLRTEDWKYCVYDRGRKREALFDMKNDPLEMKNVAGEEMYKDVVARHRQLLRDFAAERGDERAADMLADDVTPRPFGS